MPFPHSNRFCHIQTFMNNPCGYWGVLRHGRLRKQHECWHFNYMIHNQQSCCGTRGSYFSGWDYESIVAMYGSAQITIEFAENRIFVFITKYQPGGKWWGVLVILPKFPNISSTHQGDISVMMNARNHYYGKIQTSSVPNFLANWLALKHQELLRPAVIP